MDEISSPKRPRLDNNKLYNMTSPPGAGECTVATNNSQSEESCCKTNVSTCPPPSEEIQQDGSSSVLNAGEGHCCSSSSTTSDNSAQSNEKQWVNLGCSKYNKLNECRGFIDKSLFAWYFFHDDNSRVYTTAPAQFGKSTILNMLKKFFQIQINKTEDVIFKNVKQEEDGKLVEDLNSLSKTFKTFKTKKIFELCHCCSIPADENCCECKQWFYQHCGQHPVILIDLADIDSTSLDDILRTLKTAIRKAYEQHEYLVKEVNGKTVWSSTLNEKMDEYYVYDFLRYFNKDCNKQFWRRASQESKKQHVLNGLPKLAKYLSLHFKTQESGKGVILLIDNFDACVCKMIFKKKDKIEKIVEEVTDFIQNWTSCILKECTFVEKALILACSAMGSILLSSFGENNIQHRLFLDSSNPYSELFGFTEQEVDSLVDIYLRTNYNNTVPIEKKKEMLANINEWYEGYSIKGTEKKIYSTCSILNYLQSSELGCYWKDKKVGSNHLDALLAETSFQEKVFQLLDSTTSIDIVDRIEPEHICSLNELIKNPGRVNKGDVDLFLQFLTVSLM